MALEVGFGNRGTTRRSRPRRRVAVLCAAGGRLRATGNRPPLLLFAPAASSTRSERPPSWHTPSEATPSPGGHAERTRGVESLRPISGFAAKRRAPNGHQPRTGRRRVDAGSYDRA